MKKLLLAIVAVLILLVLVAFFGPAAYDWNGHKADIADAVRDATGANSSSTAIFPYPCCRK